MSESPIRLLLVDDYPSSREPTAELLDRLPDMAVVGQAGSVAEARALLAAGLGVDVALVDLDLPDGNGTDLVRDLRRRNPEATALVVTGSRDPLEHARAVEAGAAHVLHKSAPIRDVVDAVRRLCAGETLLSPRDAVALLRRLGEERERVRETAAAFARLTPREREIVALLAEAPGDREIAARLGVSEKTVRNHMTTLMEKLGVESRLQVLVLAVRHGLVAIR